MAPLNPDHLAANLRAERARAQLTREQLAERSGVSAATIGRIENGCAAIVTTVAQLAAALDVTIDTLLRAPEFKP